MINFILEVPFWLISNCDPPLQSGLVIQAGCGKASNRQGDAHITTNFVYSAEATRNRNAGSDCGGQDLTLKDSAKRSLSVA
jgi:hypothetical protein